MKALADTCLRGHPKAQFWSVEVRRPYCRECKRLDLIARRRAQGVKPRLSTEAIFLDHLAYVGDCIVWTGYLNPAGYGIISINNRPRRAHRYAYERLHGPIAPGLHLDHLCRNRCCVNPGHLEPVTIKVNVNRGISKQVTRERALNSNACRNGHPLTVETRLGGKNRRCRMCRREHLRRWRAKKAQALGKGNSPCSSRYSSACVR